MAPNDGHPYVAGKLADRDEPMVMPGAERDGRRVLQEAPAVAFEPGARVPIWHSPDAPTFSYNDERANNVPVAAMPVRPGLGRILLSLGLACVVAVAGLVAAAWVRRRAEQLTGMPSGR